MLASEVGLLMGENLAERGLQALPSRAAAMVGAARRACQTGAGGAAVNRATELSPAAGARTPHWRRGDRGRSAAGGRLAAPGCPTFRARRGPGRGATRRVRQTGVRMPVGRRLR